jgi:ABC-type multidrug transport system fused ATPase/permease subunit
MIKVILEAFSVLNMHKKLGLLRFQAVLVFMAITEVLSIASIGQFISLIVDINQIYDPSNKFGSLKIALDFSSPQSFVVFIGVIVISILILSALNSTFCLRYIYRYSHALGAELSARLFSSYMSKDLIFFNLNNTSKLINNIVGECSRAAHQIYIPALTINSKLIVVLAIFIYMLGVSWATTLVGFLTFGLC